VATTSFPQEGQGTMSRAPTVPLAAPSFIGWAGGGDDAPGEGVGVRIEPLIPAGRLDRPEGVGGKAACSPGTPADIDKGETEAIAGLAEGAGWLGAAATSATAGAGAAGEEGGVLERVATAPVSAGLTAVAAGAGAAGASSLAPHPRQNL
jgi:hypothetical protein